MNETTRKQAVKDLTAILYRMVSGEGYPPARAAEAAVMIVDLIAGTYAVDLEKQIEYVVYNQKERVVTFNDPATVAEFLNGCVLSVKRYDVIGYRDGEELFVQRADQWLRDYRGGSALHVGPSTP